MMTACAGNAITAACADHLDAAEDFLTWENESWFDSRGLFSVGSDTLHQHLEYGRDLDQLIVEEMREVQAGNQSLTDARVAIVTRASSYDGGMNLFMSGVTAAGVGLVCYGTAGAGCALAVGAGVIGQGDELVDGAVTLVNGVPTQNPTEAALIAAGATPEQAQQIESWIDIGATVVDLGGGVVIGVKGGQLVDDLVRLTGPRATATNRPPNLNVRGLDELPDPALNPNGARTAVSQHLRSGVDADDVSVATASVTVNGKTEYFIGVSGKSYSGAAPNTLTINGRTYTVVRSDSGSVAPVNMGTNANGTPITNKNHAEQKLFSHIQDNYAGQNANVNVAVQNTSRQNPGMCQGCSTTSPNFAGNNSGFNVNMFHGTTGQNP
jgi:hypothetical protein